MSLLFKSYARSVVMVMILMFIAMASVAQAASYDLVAQQDFQGQEDRAPEGIRARVTVLPDGKIKPGEVARFVIRIYNDGASAAGGINISFIPDSQVAELVAAKPLLDFATDHISSWEAAGWSNVSIPAHKSRDFSISYRVSPTQSATSVLSFTAWVGQDSYQIDRSFDVGISATRGTQTAVNTSGLDNFFRVATGRFPTAAERTQWAARYKQYQTNRSLGATSENRIGSFMKEIAKKVGSTKAGATKGVMTEKKLVAADILPLFNSIYNRTPTTAEQKYWVGRLKDKNTSAALRGAMAYQKAHGKSPKVLAASTRVKISGGGDDSVTAGTKERITVTYQAYPYGGSPVQGTLQAAIGSPDVSNISPEATEKTRDEKQGKIFLNWNYTLAPSETISVAFDVKVPRKGVYGDSFVVSAYASEGYNYRSWTINQPEAKATPTPTPVPQSVKSTPGLTSGQVTSIFRSVYGRPPTSPELTYWYKRAIEKRTAATLKGSMAFQKAQGKSPKDTTKPTPTPKPVPKITEKEFRLLGPDTFNTERAGQDVSWYVTDAVRSKYPNVKVELCPGKDFKNCVIAEAVEENDGSFKLEMPPIPRTGKWYLHLIARNTSDGLVPNVSAARLVKIEK